MIEYYKKLLTKAEVELAELESVKEELVARERNAGSNQYIKEKYRLIIRIFFWRTLIEQGRLDIAEAYNSMKNDPNFADNASEFIHQLGTCGKTIGMEVEAAKQGHLKYFDLPES